MRELDPGLLEKAGELGIVIIGTWGNKRIQQEIDKVENAKVEGADNLTIAEAESNLKESADNMVKPIVDRVEALVDKFTTIEWANERAAKIWEGQSTSLTIIERVGRIRQALKERGFTRFDDLVIPTTEDYKKFL